MTVSELINNVEIQNQVLYGWYDYLDKEERIDLSYEEAKDKDIRYLYIEDDSTIYIEVDMED